MRNGKIKKLARLAIFVAITLLLAYTPLGYLRTAGLELSFLMIPVAVSAIVLGPLEGMIVGAVFGITSFVQCLTGASAFGATLLGISPIACFLVCVPTRMLAGLLPGFLYRLFSLRGPSVAGCAVCSAAAPVINTVLFMGALVLFFFNTEFIQNLSHGLGVLGFCAMFVGVQGVVEAVVCCLVSTPVSRGLLHATKAERRAAAED